MTVIGIGTPGKGASGASSGLRPQIIVGARAALLVLWVGWATLAWWSAPRPADVAQIDRDIAAGAVRSVVTANGWDSDNQFWITFSAARVSPNGSLIVWTTASGQTRYAAPGLPAHSRGLAGFWGDGQEPQTQLLVARLRDAAQSAGRTAVVADRMRTVANLLAGVSVLLFLSLLIRGPAPVRGTRWFWIGVIPFGLGVLTWLARERQPNPASTSQPKTGKLTRKQRESGLTGFALALVASIALSLLAFGLRQLLGPGLIPG